ncbi:hypothetical protein E4P39_17240 [Blastococcus sp. CT_GayMR19]|uniref:hypothetical protein n=1 Tax=Blastococcus sp. CT_GayMR19 TaxID=2559608 RepID=UPI001073CC69|nr:hypothetical protein [Blastococcus sp. CT_GayMR19]TFV72235.1 hypothetical protein E4P39_17240 [Blastococcus sp. CT_GayMR19]
MTSQQPGTDDTSADRSRSGKDIAEAIDVAERGSAVEEVHDRGTEAKSGEAPVERSADDPEMTEGQVVYGSDAEGSGAAPGTSPGATPESSGVAQSVPGARRTDQVAAGQEPETPAG